MSDISFRPPPHLHSVCPTPRSHTWGPNEVANSRLSGAKVSPEGDIMGLNMFPVCDTAQVTASLLARVLTAQGLQSPVSGMTCPLLLWEILVSRFQDWPGAPTESQRQTTFHKGNWACLVGLRKCGPQAYLVLG